jgi:Holliday junction resolvase RusA-like endonuclease
MIAATWTGKVVGCNRRLIMGRGRMIANREYTAFVQDMARVLRQRPASKKVVTSVTLALTIPTRMDVDAIIKPCLDAIQCAGIVANDNEITRVTAEREGVSKRGEESTIRFELE